jgi:hypothetical protein
VLAAALHLFLLALAEPQSCEPPVPPQQAPEIAPTEVNGWHFAGIPIAAYASDVGLTLGAALFFYEPIPGHPDEHREFTIGFSYATRGPKAVDMCTRMRRLFGTSLRTVLNLHAGDDELMPYWGEGARLGGLSVPPGYASPPEPYRYHDRRLFVTGLLRAFLVGPFGWHVRARFLDVDVVRPSALLAASSPPGARGGRVALGEAGLFLDTRDRELGTHQGVFLAAAAFAAPQLGGFSDFEFHGYDVAAHAYVPLWPGGTLAVRGLYDRKLAGIPSHAAGSAAVPFFERTLYEGVSFDEGLGGAGTIRGIARYRVEGPEKMLANVQLRVNLFSSHLLAKTQDYGVDAGVDAGRARQPGYAAVDGAGAAVGLRLLWDRAILLRVEMGRARGGENTLYIAFGEQF